MKSFDLFPAENKTLDTMLSLIFRLHDRQAFRCGTGMRDHSSGVGVSRAELLLNRLSTQQGATHSEDRFTETVLDCLGGTDPG